MASLDNRRHQVFPVLDPAQFAIACRFASGPEQRFAPNESIYAVGQRGVPAWLISAGSIAIVRRDGLGHEMPLAELGPGQFTGEVGQLAGQASLAAARAGAAGCVACPLDAAHLRALLIGSAEVGEVMMRALILRRVGLIEGGTAGSVLVGTPGHPDLVRLQGFLARNGYPHTTLDVTVEGEGRALVERLGLHAEDLPLMVCTTGEILRRPSEAQVGVCLGLTPELDPARLYDVIVVGAGPAGLAAAVYAASEGLEVLVLDQRAIGGQAGASARIENYLGFPTGISGQALAGRAYNQAQKFGAELAIPLQATRLECGGRGERLRLHLSNGTCVQARTIVVASGARYRRPAIPQLEVFEGAGVSYWASPVEARLCEGEEVALVGAGNSAGQAVAFLSPRVRRLHLVVRGAGLEASMSRYLIERIAALPNVELLTGTEVTALEGDRAQGLCAATLQPRGGGTGRRQALRHLFLFIGADPNADWLAGQVSVDRAGFVLTGAARPDGRPVLPLETDWPGVFAIGDVRAGSTKRVAAAVGEGAAVVAQIHSYLAAHR